MKQCPYNIHVEQVNENAFEYDTDGHEICHSHKLIEKQFPMPCTGKDCGAWRFGRCQRRQ